ncbi:DUF5050 domain-containing protein [Paenibacillus sp. TRM 82003]|nr:DUF5050 domain-containing protein [Paenibacillus sp. TRM 82003]
MNYNVPNGGLAIRLDDRWLLGDMKTYRTRPASPSGGMRWFMNADDDFLYYSDQRRGNALCRSDRESGREETLREQPCSHVFLDRDRLYYINEEDRRLYRCFPDGKEPSRVTEEAVDAFALEGGRLSYAAAKGGIYVCTDSGQERERISDASASCLVRVEDRIAYADRNNDFAVTFLDPVSNETVVIDGAASPVLNTDGRYVYCANRLHDRSVYRIDPRDGRSIRICGESVEYVHIFGDELLCCIAREWHRMPLTGGAYERMEMERDG